MGWPKLAQAAFQSSGIEDAEVCIDLPALGIVEKCDGNAARSDGVPERRSTVQQHLAQWQALLTQVGLYGGGRLALVDDR